MAIVDQFIAPLASVAIKAIQEFHASPEEKMQAQQAITDAANKAQAQAADYDVQLNSIAGQNIRSEEGGDDKFTKRARPWFMYIIEAILAFNYIAVPSIQMLTAAIWHTSAKVSPFELPTNLLELFGVCVTGYVFNRSAEKIAALPGDSSILGGLVRNKS